jgi:acyl-[acyl carrier protein]--UDP-N-acetylglucosamine O-acyltransferase
VTAVRNAFKTVFRNNLTLKEAIAALETEMLTSSEDAKAALMPLVAFLQTPGRGLAR